MEKLTGSDLQFTDVLQKHGGEYALHVREPVIPALTGAGIRIHGKIRPHKTTGHRKRWMKIIDPMDIRSKELGGTGLNPDNPDRAVFPFVQSLQLRTERGPGK